MKFWKRKKGTPVELVRAYRLDVESIDYVVR